MENYTLVTGEIYTANPKKSIVDAFVIKDGKIIYVGNLEGAKRITHGQGKIIEHKSGLIIPGMTEGHAHVTCATELLFGVLLLDAMETLDDYAEAIIGYMDTQPDEDIIMGSGYVNGMFGEMGPTAKLLDQWIPDKPAIFVGSDHHSYWINTKAMELIQLNKDTKEVPNGGIVRYPDTNEPTGWLKESAALLLDPIKPTMTVDHYKKAILHYQEIALSNGITVTFEPMYDIKKDYEIRCRAYEELAHEGKLKIMFRCGYTIDSDDNPEEIIEIANSIRKKTEIYENFQLNTIKLFIDGVVEGHTAYLLEEYQDAPGDFGEPLLEQKQLTDYVSLAMKNGYMVHTHAIGDAGLEMVLNAYEDAQCSSEKQNHRNAITHLQIIAQPQIKRMKELGVVAVVNPYWHIKNPVYFNNLEIPYLGKERAEKQYLVKGLKKEGIHTSQASDFPVTYPPESMLSLDIMVNRKWSVNKEMEPLGIEEALTVEDALETLTIEGAYQNQLDANKGSIEVGKDADFVLLDQNILTIKKESLYKTRILKTYIKGKKVWEE